MFLPKKLLNLPNKLTVSRLLLSPLFAYVFFQEGVWAHGLVLAISLAQECTDLMDGYIARSRGQVTDFGKLFDPFADSISRFTIFLCFLVAGWAPLWMLLIIFYRDSLVTTLRLHSARFNVVLSARLSGKAKAIVQGTVINALLSIIFLRDLIPSLRTLPFETISTYSMLIVTLVTAWSALDYTLGSKAVLRKLG